MKSTAERTIEALTWASVVIWLGMALLMHLLDYVWLVVLGLSIILLSSAIYQRSRGWQTSLSIWVFGVWMAISSVLELVNVMLTTSTGGSGLQIDLWVYLGVALVSMGVAVVLRMIRGPNLTLDASRSRGGQQPYSGDQRPAAPRPVYDNLSYGSIPSPQERGTYGSAPGRGSMPPQAPYDQGRTTGTSRQNQAPRYDQQGDEYDYGYDAPAYDQTGYTQRGPGTRRDLPGRYTPPPQQVPYDQGQNYGYDPNGDPAYDQGYEQQPPINENTGYGRDPRGVYQEPSGYTAPSYPEQQSYQQQAYQPPARQQPPPRQPAARRQVTDRRRVSPQARRSQPAQPQKQAGQQQPSDLDARIEDIIRRSREKRNVPPEDLPY